MQGMGDRVTAKAVPGTPGTLSIEHITGDGGRLSLEPAKNCIGIAAQATVDMYKAAGHPVDVAISLSLVKVRRGCLLLPRCSTSCAAAYGRAGTL